MSGSVLSGWMQRPPRTVAWVVATFFTVSLFSFLPISLIFPVWCHALNWSPSSFQISLERWNRWRWMVERIWCRVQHLKTGLPAAALPGCSSSQLTFPGGPDVASSQMSYPDFFGFNQSSLTFHKFYWKNVDSVDEFMQNGECVHFGKNCQEFVCFQSKNWCLDESQHKCS